MPVSCMLAVISLDKCISLMHSTGTNDVFLVMSTDRIDKDRTLTNIVDKGAATTWFIHLREKMEKGSLMRKILTLLVLSTVIVTPFGCRKETEQDKVKKVIHDIQRAAEEKNIKNIINNLSKTYSDPQGFNYDTIKGLLLGYFFQHPKVSAYITDLDISVENTFAKAVFQAVLTGGSKTGSAADLIPESLGIYAFVVELKKEPDGWKVTAATWERVGESEHKGGQ